MSEQVYNITTTYAQVDWRFTRGDTFLQEFLLEDEDENGVVTPADLDDSEFEMVITDCRGVEVATLTLGSGISVIGAGEVRVHVVAADTADWPDLKQKTTFTFVWTRATTPVVKQTIIRGHI